MAQENCAATDVMERGLLTKFGETPQILGLVSDTAIFRLFVNVETGDWTGVITFANGKSCRTIEGIEFQTTIEQLIRKPNL